MNWTGNPIFFGLEPIRLKDISSLPHPKDDWTTSLEVNSSADGSIRWIQASHRRFTAQGISGDSWIFSGYTLPETNRT